MCVFFPHSHRGCLGGEDDAGGLKLKHDARGATGSVLEDDKNYQKATKKNTFDLVKL